MMMVNGKVMAASVALICAGSAFGEEVTLDLPFPTFGFFETFFTSGNTAYDGYTVTGAELHLEFEMTSGDAANIEFFMYVPVDADPSTPALDEVVGFTTGELLGWSGTGTFSHTFDISGAIGGEFIADVVYAGGFYGDFPQIGGPPADFAVITENSVFQLTLVPAPSSLALLGFAAPVAMRRRRQ